MFKSITDCTLTGMKGREYLKIDARGRSSLLGGYRDKSECIQVEKKGGIEKGDGKKNHRKGEEN